MQSIPGILEPIGTTPIRTSSSWTQKISSLKLKTPMNVLDESYEGTNQQQQEVLCGIGFGPKILDTIAGRVVDKIVHDGALAGAKPKFNIKEEKQ